MQRPPIPIRPASLDDRARVAAIMADAFADDPALSFIFPDAATRPERLRRFFMLIQRTENDPALTNIAGENAAAAIWRRPGEWQTPTLTMLKLAVPMLTTFGGALSRALRLQSLLESHHPRTPHWYLAFLGCERRFQGKGYGGAAVRARLAQCDAAGLPAALETATESNLAIYTAMGFRITDSFKLDDGPQFWGMWRDPA
jgi:GNAT superfamily N-acetyltransferase